MTAARLDLFKLAKAARADMLRAFDHLPSGAAVSRPGFGIPLMIAQNYASAHQVLVTDADSYGKPWAIRNIIEDGLGENLFTMEGDAWLAHRQPCARVFGMSQMEGLARIVTETVEGLAQSWEPGEVDIQEAMTTLTMRVAMRALLGADDDTEGLTEEVSQSFNEILDWVGFRFNHPASAPAVVPTPRNRRLQTSKENLRVVLRRLLQHRKANDTGAVDVLSQLVRAQREAGEGPSTENPTVDVLTDEAILDECVGFMFAGHDTTASTLTWALYELALHPELQEVVAGEGARFRSQSDTFVEATEAMTETAAIVEETLRMYPAGVNIGRSAKRRTEIAGEPVRRGTMVLIPVYAIQRSPEVWDNPNTFDPGRPIPADSDGFLPFGLGPRRCLGARFARTELRIVLGRVCADWRLSYPGSEPPKPVIAPALRAENDLPLTLAPR